MPALLAGVGRVMLPDPIGFYITRYVEFEFGCGGCRIEYADGTVKTYDCSCDTPKGFDIAA
jgi:hypothetical protein